MHNMPTQTWQMNRHHFNTNSKDPMDVPAQALTGRSRNIHMKKPTVPPPCYLQLSSKTKVHRFNTSSGWYVLAGVHPKP